MNYEEQESNINSRVWLFGYSLLLGSLGMVIGYEFGMLNTFFKPFIYYVHNITDTNEMIEIVGNLNFVLMVGVTLNSLIGSQLISKYGRWRILQATTIGNILSFFILMIPNFFLMYIARFIGGFCGGFCFNLPPLIFKELFPKRFGQTMASFYYIFHTIGIMIPYAFGTKFWAEHWRWVFFFPLLIEIPKLFLLINTFKIETPQWLFYNSENKERDILDVYSRIYAQEYAKEQTQSFIEDMNCRQAYLKGEVTLVHLLSEKHFKPFLLALFLCASHQTSGISYLIFYSRNILEQMEFNNPTLITFFMGTMNVIAGIYITLYANKSSRRDILLNGMLYQTIALGILITGILNFSGFLVVLGLYIFMFSWGISMGGILVPYLADIIPQAGVSYAGILRWLINCFNAKFALSFMTYFGYLNVFTSFFFMSLISTIIFVRFGIKEESSQPSKLELMIKRHSR